MMIVTSEWPVLCRDGVTRILVVESDKETGEIYRMYRKEVPDGEKEDI